MEGLLFLYLVICYFAVVFLIRNNNVYKFVTSLNHRCYEVMYHKTNLLFEEENDLSVIESERDRLYKIWDSITDVSYLSMVLKIWKPLTPEAWLNDEQLEFLGI